MLSPTPYSLSSSYISSHFTTKSNQSNAHCSSENLSKLRENICGIHNSRATFLRSMLHSETETKAQLPTRNEVPAVMKHTAPGQFRIKAPTAMRHTAPGELRNEAPTATKLSAIDQFIAKLDKVKIETQPQIGAGSYGTCYRCGDFVIKVPVNSSGNFVDWNSPEHKNAKPERVSRYLNEANNDCDYSRSAQAVFNNKPMNVLVSKFVQGHELDVDNEENYFRASDHLESRGLYMHDINVMGNILVDKNDNLHIIDGDQLVLSQAKRLERQPSMATTDLEDQIESSLLVKLKMATNRKNEEDITYYQDLVDDLKDLRGK
ncbi:hypothetical protein ACIPDS_01030 [Kluyvera sp. NPDC087067]|uniref:hypothetical protein n=1 Tax=Kluyvera sp. NPDC087067 TaxID=3364105 RepID=UPI00382D64E1